MQHVKPTPWRICFISKRLGQLPCLPHRRNFERLTMPLMKLRHMTFTKFPNQARENACYLNDVTSKERYWKPSCEVDRHNIGEMSHCNKHFVVRGHVRFSGNKSETRLPHHIEINQTLADYWVSMTMISLCPVSLTPITNAADRLLRCQR